MSERKFTKGLCKPGMAAQVRETVSQVVRESNIHNKPHLVEPINFEDFILKNKTLLQNDTHRELLLYPSDDFSQVVLPRRFRTLYQSLPNKCDINDCNLLTKTCLNTYMSNWNLVHYKYNAYSQSYAQLPKLTNIDVLNEEIFEVDLDVNKDNNELNKLSGEKICGGVIKEGYLMKGPTIGGINERLMFGNLGSKSFKRRYCYLRQQVDGTFILELHKDEKKAEAKVTILMDFCTEIIKNSKRGLNCFELKMIGDHKSYSFGTDNEQEFKDWLQKLNSIIQHNKSLEDRRDSSLERGSSTSSTPSTPSSQTSMLPSSTYGTLKSLEQSLNPQLIKYARETEISIAHSRRENRKRLFNLYPITNLPYNIRVHQSKQNNGETCVNVVQQNGGGGNNSRSSSICSTNAFISSESAIEPYKEQFGTRILVKCENLSFRLQMQKDNNVTNQIEPYLTTLCLFDIRQNKKLTENFHFDINDNLAREMLVPNLVNDSELLAVGVDPKEVPQKWFLYPRQCVFNIINPHADIFLVVKIDKILQGGICQTSEPYLKPMKDQKSCLKLQKNIRQYCDRNIKYRQPFAWCARPLFRMYSNELDTTSDFPAIYRQEPNRLTDDEILKFLQEFRKPEKFNKLTIIGGQLKIRIEQLTNESQIENSLTTCLVPVKPFPIPPVASYPTLECVEFEDGLSEKEMNAYTQYINHLYIYPQNLFFDTQKVFTRARNIAIVVQMRDNDKEDSKPLLCIYGGSNSAPLVKQYVCHVTHHNTNPYWYDEIKIRLPINLNDRHHLLFKFYHVSCELSKKHDNGSDSQVENCVGYAWLPLLSKGRLNTVDTQCLPVACKLPQDYLSVQPLGLGKGNAGPEIIWVDQQKPIFSLKFQLVSSVNTRDQHLHNLFAHTEKLFKLQKLTLELSPKSQQNRSPSPQENETCKILKALHAIQLSTLITFFPTLVNHLLHLLITTSENSSDDIGLNVVRVIINLCYMLYEATRKDIMLSYVKYVFVHQREICEMKNTTVHEQFAKHLPVLLNPSNTDFLLVNKFMCLSWFFFEIMVKSMAQHLISSTRIKMHRNERFPHEYMERIELILQLLTPYISIKVKEMPIETQQLNQSLATFLKKCLSFMDRGVVFKLINTYLDKINTQYEQLQYRTLYEYKFEFLRIISSHEHYISLNLPLQHTRLSPLSKRNNGSISSPVDNNQQLSEYYLTDEFFKHHFLVSLLLQEVKFSLVDVNPVRKMALATLRDLLAKHELDDRYQSRGQMSRIAMLYVPWLAIVLDNLSSLSSLIAEEKFNSDYNLAISKNITNDDNKLSNIPTSRGLSQRMTLYLDTNSHRDSSYFAAIAGQALLNGHSSMSLDSDISTMSDGDASTRSQETAIIKDFDSTNVEPTKNHTRSISNTPQHRCDRLQISEIKDMLICALFILKHIGDETLITWWQQTTNNDIHSFLSLLQLCLKCFKYPGKDKITVSSLSSSNNNAIDGRFKQTLKAHTLPARMTPPDFSQELQTTQQNNAVNNLTYTNTINRENLAKTENELSRTYQSILESNLTGEVSLIVLDCIGLFSMHFRDKLLVNDCENPIMKKIFSIFIEFIQIGQSETIMQHVFAALRAFINNYSIALFKGDASMCGSLCYELLKCCNSRLASTRQEACAILYLLMRNNFEYTGRKSVTRVHLQVIIGVSQMLGVQNTALNNSKFHESLSLINSYAASDKAMKGSNFVLEVKDLTKRIRTVLMATLQMREYNHDPEMSVELQHSLANSYASTPELRRTWLETMTRNHLKDGNFSEAACCQLHIAALIAEYLKLKNIQNWGAEAFEKISRNITKDEKGLKLDNGIQDMQYTEQILLEQLELCADYLQKAERYENLGELYRLIIPMYEKRRRYDSLTQCYDTLSKAYSTIINVLKTGRRLFGRYYRVILYGQMYFEEISGEEFIYKEPKVTSLSEISERLHKLYSDKFGVENVKLIMDSTTVNVNELDKKYAHIQVTHVTPYFDKTELDERQTDFEQNHDVNCFMFETPFTLDSAKVRTTPAEQWKRRMILYTEHSFPYVKKRIRVCERRVVELNPIEVAIDEMQVRVAELAEVVLCEQKDVKKLQLRLQGSVCVQVNAGPLAYAQVFLDPSQSIYSEDKVEELKDIFREFLKISYAALQLNAKLISPDQVEYQEALRDNYKKLCQSLSQLLNESLWPYGESETGSFKRNSLALFSAISGASHNSSTA